MIMSYYKATRCNDTGRFIEHEFYEMEYTEETYEQTKGYIIDRFKLDTSEISIVTAGRYENNEYVIVEEILATTENEVDHAISIYYYSEDTSVDVTNPDGKSWSPI